MDADPPTIGWSYHDKIVIIHATLGGVATMVLVPAGILIRRYVYPRGQWFAVHATIMALAFAMIIVTFALNVNMVGNEFTGSDPETTHHQLGLSVFVVISLQVIAGIVAHFTPGKQSDEKVHRHPLRWVHKLVGILTLGLLYTTVYEGFEEWALASDAQTAVPRAVKIVFWVLLGLFAAAYLVGLAVGRRRDSRQRSRVGNEDALIGY